MPAPEAHFYNSGAIINTGYLAQIDVGLFDKWFFQWHRSHIEIQVLTDFSGTSFADWTFRIFDASEMKNGLYLNPYPIFLTVLSCLTLCLCGTNICLNIKYNKKNVYNWIVIIGLTFLIFVMLFMGLIFYFGNILQNFMVLTLDVRRADADFKWFAHHGGADPTGQFDNRLMTEYNLTSVVISYSWLGIAGIVFISVCGTIICVFGCLDYVDYFQKKKAN